MSQLTKHDGLPEKVKSESFEERLDRVLFEAKKTYNVVYRYTPDSPEIRSDDFDDEMKANEYLRQVRANGWEGRVIFRYT